MVPVNGIVDSSWPLAREAWAGREAESIAGQSCGRAAAANGVAVRVHDAIARADHCLWIDLIGKTDARSEVLEVVVDRSAAVAGVGSSARKLQRAVDAGNRVRQIGVEEAHVVVRFAKRWEEVLAKAEIQGQLLGDLPVVLNVGRDGTEARPILLHEILGEASLVVLTDQEAGVGEAGVSGGCVEDSSCLMY